MAGMDTKPCLVTLSAREADRNLAMAIDRLRSGEARAVLLTRHGFNVGVIVAPRDASGEVQHLIEQNPPSMSRRIGGARR